jgi:hypothetical protein
MVVLSDFSYQVCHNLIIAGNVEVLYGSNSVAEPGNANRLAIDGNRSHSKERVCRTG